MRVFVIAFALAPLSGCTQTTQPDTRYIYVSIEVESNLQNDPATIYLDYSTLLQSRINTNPVLSLAWSSGLQQLSHDIHYIYFAASELGAHGGYTIDLKDDTSTVTINVDRSSKQVTFRQYKGRLLRD